MTDFFISYNSADKAMAAEVASAFRDAGYSVKFAGWELGLGDGIDRWMWDAIEECDRCIGIFSRDYLKKEAVYSQVERETYWWQGITNMRASIIPVIVADCKMPKVLAAKVYYDLRKGSLADLVTQWKAHPIHGLQPIRKTVFLNRQRLDRPIHGREQDLVDLVNGLSVKGKATLNNAVLKGGGGVGKTTLAKYFIHQNHRDYDGVIWCNAENRSSLIGDLYRLYTYIKNDLPPEQKTEQGAASLIDMMAQRNERWLYVYDNLPDMDAMRGLVPQGHLIVTTRSAPGWDGFSVHTTEPLETKDESAAADQVLMDSAGRDDDAAGALALARALGGLPLALVIAGAMIRSDQLGFAEYLGKVAEIIAREPKNDDYPNSVIGALRLSYDRLDSDAKQIADVFAWFAPEGLEAGLILDAPGGRWEFNKTDMPENLQELAQASGRVAAGIEALVDRSILRRGTAGYELHRMSAAALRAMQGDALLNGAAAALLAAVYPYDSDHSGNWPACRRLTPHLRALWGSGDAPKIAAMDFLLNQASVFLDRIGDVQGDLELARASLSLTEARLPEEDRAIAVGHANLGGSLYRSGDLEGAEASLRRAIALDEAHRPESIDLAESYDLLGAVLLDKGRGGAPDALWQSLRAYQKSAAILRHYVPRASDARAQALNNIGAVRDVLGQAAAALRLAEFSLAIRRQILPAGEARLGYGLMNTGSSALTSGAAERAEPLLSEALYLRRSVYIEAPKHPEIVTTADWLVACLLTRARGGEDAAARQAQARALSDEFGFDYDHYVELAKQYPYTPKGT